MRHYSLVLAYRGLAYLLLVILFGVFSNTLIFEGAILDATHIFLALGIVAVGQMLATFRNVEGQNTDFTLFAFFLADAAISMILVKSSGASSSPFLVLFPLLALASPLVFRGKLSYF